MKRESSADMRPEKLPFIVGLGGTTRPGSSTELALRFTLKVAGELGAETKMFGGHDLLMPIYDPYMAERTENAAGLIEALRRCDGVVIASPGYHGSVSGLVKNALDYTEDMRNDLEPYFEGRSVGCIACALGSQATGTTLVTVRCRHQHGQADLPARRHGLRTGGREAAPDIGRAGGQLCLRHAGHGRGGTWLSSGRFPSAVRSLADRPADCRRGRLCG